MLNNKHLTKITTFDRMFIMTQNLQFPPTTTALPDGLLATGGDLSEAQLLLAYKSGIFPWYNEGSDIEWYAPDPRFVLYPHNIHISKSMQQVLKKNTYTFTYNKAFEQVMINCKVNNRKNQDGTWITNAMQIAYNNLHKKGIAISAEAWHNDVLVGGLYGVLMGKVFCGESMFALEPNASKFAFIHLVNYLTQLNIALIDCQVYTQHLESLGATMISRIEFEQYLLL